MNRVNLSIASREGLEVTDDVSIVEYLNAPVKITQGSYTNLKVGGFFLITGVWVDKRLFAYNAIPVLKVSRRWSTSRLDCSHF